MGKGNDILGLALGMALGMIGLAIATAIIKPKCPACKSEVKRGEPICDSCGVLLKWK